MKNLFALAAGMALAAWGINHWLAWEQRVCGLVSGGNVIVPPPQATGGS